MCTRSTEPSIGHGVTVLQAYWDSDCHDSFKNFRVTFIVNRPFESSEARVKWPDIKIPVEEWGEMGRFMGSRTYWWSVSWDWKIFHDDVDYAGVGNQWLRSKIIEFFEGFKKQKHLTHLEMRLCPGRDAPQLDINYLVSHSVRFRTLELRPCVIQTLNKRVILCPAETGTLSHASIPTIKLNCYGYLPIEDVLPSCLKMKHLHIDSPSKSTAPAFSEMIGLTILQNRSSRLITLHIKSLGSWKEGVMNGLVSSIAEGIRVNTTLQELVLKGHQEYVSVLPIATSLCDPSSIDSIVNSNHTLKSVYFTKDFFNRFRRCRKEMEETDLLMKCVDINVSGKSRNDIIQKKVVDFHMTTNFDVTQLDNLPLTALPNLLAIPSKSENNCLHGIFWILKHNLELSDVKARSSDVG